eukprot:361438-Chlamydomonas_euryale.AAC.3
MSGCTVASAGADGASCLRNTSYRTLRRYAGGTADAPAPADVTAGLSEAGGVGLAGPRLRNSMRSRRTMCGGGPRRPPTS